jgi:hypothetical protein
MGRGRVIARKLLAGLAAGFMGKVLDRENSLSAPVAKENRRKFEATVHFGVHRQCRV